MPQLDSGGGGAGGDDLGAPDELLAFQDEGEEQDKSRDSAAGPERDLAELKSSLVNESEGAAGGAGVPGTGAGGEAEVGAEALGREHTSQRLFPDKLPEALEDGLKAPECASSMYKDTVYSAFNLLMHYPPPSGAGQHPQPQPPLHNKASQPAHGVPQLSPLYEHFSSPHPTPAPADINQKQVHRPLQTSDLSGFYSLTSGSMGQLPHTVSWFTHPSLMLGSSVPGHPAAIPHPAIVPPSGKQELQPYDRSLGRRRGDPEKSTKNPTQITLFTIPRRKKKCIRYLPGEGRCPSPFPSDDSTLGCSGSPAPQDSPSYLLLPHFPTALLASPAEPAPTSPGLSAALSLPAPWAPTGPQQCPAEYTGTATGISEAGSLACTGHLASSRDPLFEKQQQSPKARGNRSGALLTSS
ncbi:transcription factor 7 isoform X2 [Myotis daubentonii]|uniref:transcription factor 7 isoform X2 n=1 Tax=Myotis daubentonii TaxID=98922 RepID=UPI0028731281|nr:transcription factor 7 isoform X2 [Myotis daubentonii]